jgi:hypothetical protein
MKICYLQSSPKTLLLFGSLHPILSTIDRIHKATILVYQTWFTSSTHVSSLQDLLHQCHQRSGSSIAMPWAHRIYATSNRVHRIGSTPWKTVSTAADLLHRRPRPPHRIYFTDDRVHHTGLASPTPSCTSPEMPSLSRRTPCARQPRRSAIGFIVGCYLYVDILRREFLGCDLISAFTFAISSFYCHTPRIVMSCVCVPSSS